MKIESPFVFDLYSFHITFSNRNESIKQLIPKEFKCLERFEVQVSHATSSQNSNENIFYNEVLIKALVEYMGDMYYFPIFTFVDNEVSLFRGIYFGFDKYLSKIEINEKKFFSKLADTNIDGEFNILNNKENISRKYIGYPYILKRQLKIFNEITPSICRLDSEELKNMVNLSNGIAYLSGDLVKKLFKVDEIKGDLFCSKENFICKGIKKL